MYHLSLQHLHIACAHKHECVVAISIIIVLMHDIQVYYQYIMYPGTHHCPLNQQQ